MNYDLFELIPNLVESTMNSSYLALVADYESLSVLWYPYRFL